MSLVEIVKKKSQGTELTIEERVEYLEFMVKSLINKPEDIEPTTVDKQGPPYKVISVYYVNDYQYKGVTFHRYMVQLGGHSDFYVMDKLTTTKDMTENGDLIYCKIEGDKLKDVKVLHAP